MKSILALIKEITFGAARIEDDPAGIRFYRFTEEQEKLYKERSSDFYLKTFATSGVQLRFTTNSQALFLKIDTAKSTSRTYFSVDVVVNGKKIDSLNNYSDFGLPNDYTILDAPLGEFSKLIDLGQGDKKVTVYLPWSVKTVLKDIMLDDGAFVLANNPDRTLLCFGDSITQGYDALNPCNKYSSQLANFLNAQEYNKAIGGEIFFPELAQTKEGFEPDYITVAYGTNDWSHCSKDEMLTNCREFIKNLSINYRDSKIFVITPIWRKDKDEPKAFGEFNVVKEIIQQQAVTYNNVFVIDGSDFVPQNENLFADLRLHPNDAGFNFYANNLAKTIINLLDNK